MWNTASVVGPLARTVGDLALMLTAISAAGSARLRSPTEIRPRSRGELRGELSGLRVAWCPDVGGVPIEPAVRGVLDGARDRLAALGAEVAGRRA